MACVNFLACGHYCCGTKDETECLSCLQDVCNKGNEKAFKRDDYCFICYTEELYAAPCIKSTCGHVFHYTCVIKLLNMKWNTRWISFNFCRCPLCKQCLEFPSGPSELKIKVNNIHELQKKVKQLAIEKLAIEKRDQDPEFLDPNSFFHGKADEYALKLYAFYECFKCKDPYFGGMHNCEHEMLEIEQNGEEEKQNVEKEKLTCNKCHDVRTCSTHNTDFIEWKCRFCCTMARWFCFG